MHPEKTLTDLQGWRAGLLWFTQAKQPQARHETDGLLVTAREADGIVRIQAIGPYRELAAQYPDLPTTHWPGLCIAPGFVDLHIHYPQTDVIGSPAEGLLPWLEHYTFPHEKQFSDPAYAHAVTGFFLDELMRHGVTTALCFATAHPESVDVFMAEAQKRRLRMVTGKVLQDRHSPDGLRDTDTALSLRQTEDLIRRWHGVDRLGYAITPRFAPTSTEAQLHGAGEIAQQFPDVWIQSHVAENLDEIRWVHELFPEARSYLDVYDRAGLLRQRSVYAHCIYLDEADRHRMAEVGATAAVSPTSNLFLGSGLFPLNKTWEKQVKVGLGTDIGAGTSFNQLQTLNEAYKVQQLQGDKLSAFESLYHATLGGAKALSLDDKLGNFNLGKEADFVVLDLKATALQALRQQRAKGIEDALFALMTMGDDRNIHATYIFGQKAYVQN